MRIQHVSSSEARDGQNTQTILSLQMFPAPLSRLLVHPQQLKRLESLSVTLAFKASPSLNESQDQATALLRSALLKNRKKLSASYSSLTFRAAQNLAKNLASRYPAIFNASWVERLLNDSASYRSISRSVTGLLRRPYPSVSDHVSSAFTLLRDGYPPSIPAEETQDALQYDDPEDPRLYNQNSQAQAANTDNQEAIQKALFALALHQTKRTPLFTDKDPAREWDSNVTENTHSSAGISFLNHKISRSRSSSVELEELPPTKKKKTVKLDAVSNTNTHPEEDIIIISSASEEDKPFHKPHDFRDVQYELALSLFRGHKTTFESDNDNLVIEDPDTDGEPPPFKVPNLSPLTNMQVYSLQSQSQISHTNAQVVSHSLHDTNRSPSGDSIIQTPPESDEDIILEAPDDDNDEDDMILDDSLRDLDDRIANLAYRESRLFPDEDYVPASSSQSTQDSGYTTLPSSQANSQEINSIQKSWQTAPESQVMKDVELAVDKMVMNAEKADAGDDILCCSDEE